MLFPNREDIYALVCRPALPKDTAGVMELTSRIWDGHDYVPHYWQQWLGDPDGMLAVAEYGGRVVGLAKLSRSGENQWWLQGLRVHPEYQGRGIASRLHRYTVNYWEQHCGGVLRLATSSARLPVHHLCEETGFRKAGEYLSYVAPALDEPVGTLVPLKEEDSTQALELVHRSEIFSLANRLIDLNWQWGELDSKHLVDAAREARAYWWAPTAVKRDVLVCGVDEEDGGTELYIQVAGCSLLELPAFLMDVRRLAAQRGCPRVSWMAPAVEEIRQALISEGFSKDWEHSLYLFEKRLEASAPARRSTI